MEKFKKMKSVFALIKPSVDVHTLGISSFKELLEEAGYEVIMGDKEISSSLEEPYKLNNAALISDWIKKNNVTSLGFSYRLDPDKGVEIFKSLMYQFNENESLTQLEKIAFAGLPHACEKIKHFFPQIITFEGDETPKETLLKLGINPDLVPESITRKHDYDLMRTEFSKEEIKKGNYFSINSFEKNYPGYGTEKDTLIKRLNFLSKSNYPVIRAHSGPYSPNRNEAISKYLEWCKKLSDTGFLDVLSIGSSQLSQSNFGEDWIGLSNGGGVPINSLEDLNMIYDFSRPMLVRTYAGTKNILQLAKIYEETINIAWHALSLFWFNELDGRGPYDVLTNLNQHIKTIEYAAKTRKPFEANISHHFGFRGCDDTSYVLSNFIAAKTAKIYGINDFLLQLMMNTPKKTWGIMDLAKARASLELVKELEDKTFRVLIQSRTGLDYLSHDLERAKEQLYESSLLIGDVIPNKGIPDVLHVVSYPEAHHLAQPHEIDESIQIMMYALKNNPREEYWKIEWDEEIEDRKEKLKSETRDLINLAEQRIPDLYSPKGLHLFFSSGFLPVPQLRYKIESYQNAVNWNTKIRFGRVDLYSENEPIKLIERKKILEENLRYLL
jgi:hypothetical protein